MKFNNSLIKDVVKGLISILSVYWIFSLLTALIVLL